MPKRSLDMTMPAGMTVDKVMKKTERSHEENQERAYIAASRRADRSIEARVQSARMASEIHKKRTGKGFKISEEIVMKEEMYEEEDDDLPRQYRALTAHLQTSSTDMNRRLSAYLSSQVAIASLARQQEVDRMFAEQFPNAARISQQLSKSAYYQPVQPSNAAPSSQHDYQGMNMSPTSTQFSRDRSQSISQQSVAMSPRTNLTHSPLVAEQLSPPALSPTSANTETPQSSVTPTYLTSGHGFTSKTSSDAASGLVDPRYSFTFPTNQQSSFTSELPAEAKMLGNFDVNDPMFSAFMGGNTDPLTFNGVDYTDFSSTHDVPHKDQPIPSSEGTFNPDGMHASFFDAQIGTQGSRIGTPGGGVGDNWDLWVNSDALDEHH